MYDVLCEAPDDLCFTPRHARGGGVVVVVVVKVENRNDHRYSACRAAVVVVAGRAGVIVAVDGDR